MKKFVLSLVIFFVGFSQCLADELKLDTETKFQKQVMQVGFRILNSNKIEKRVTFYYVPNKDVNAAAYSSSKRVCVFKGLLPFIDSEDELAAIISHEIAHQMDFYAGYLRRLAMSLNSEKYEMKADKAAVDFMVNAGYNPVAMLVVLNKITGEQTFSDDWGMRSHPAGSTRLAYLYEYIYAKYPIYLADNDYKNNIYYQNFLLTSKKQRAIVREKYNKQNSVSISNNTSKK